MERAFIELVSCILFLFFNYVECLSGSLFFVPVLFYSLLFYCWFTDWFNQCCGSESGSTCFWASRIRIRIHQSEVWIRIRIRPWIRILLSSCKNSKKNLDFYYFVTLFDFLSLENYVNVLSNSNKQKKCLNKNFFLVGILKVNDQKSRIRIH